MKKRVKSLKHKPQYSVLTFVVCMIIVFGVGFLGSLLTTPAIKSGWYNTVRPSITPPNYVFGIVWNVLFFLIGVSLFLVWSKGDIKDRKKVAWVFGINLALNLLWSVLYFGLHSPRFAFIEIFFLWASIIGMIFVSWKIDKTAALLLEPYLIWVSFASILNFLSIW